MIILEWIWIKARPCCEITPLISDALDRRLTLKERWRMWFHTAVCHWCRRFHKQAALIRRATHTLERAEEADAAPDASLSADARDRINSALRREL